MQQGLPFQDSSPTTVRFRGAPSVGETAPVGGTIQTPLREGPVAPVIFVRHHRARRYVLRVDAEGRVRVTIPRGGSRREADAFAQRHRDWIARQRARITSSDIPVDARRALRARAKVELPARLLALAQRHGLVVARISIRDQRTRWGSCGRDGHICLNWRLVAMPDWVSDYVLVHELMHLHRLDHSPQYWKLVAAACPHHREARQWLRTHGGGLR